MIWIALYLYVVGALATFAAILYLVGDGTFADLRPAPAIGVSLSWPISVPAIALFMVLK